MPQLFIDSSSEADNRRVVLLSQCTEQEYSKALLDTVRLALETEERALHRESDKLTNDEVRYKLGKIKAYRNVLSYPGAALEGIQAMADRVSKR